MVSRATEPIPGKERMVSRATKPVPGKERMVSRATEPVPGKERMVSRATEPVPVPGKERIQWRISTSITGVNNNEYQISRGTELNRLAGLTKSCEFVKADFMKMSFSEDTFDAVYAIEATCHAPDVVGCYKEIYRVLKPGQYFAAYECCMTGHYNPNNEIHKKVKAEIEFGSGLSDVRTTRQCVDALKLAGFEVIWEKDLAADSPIPWYLPLDTSYYVLGDLLIAMSQ
ncbi:cycloartenol-C-24-methyltransferase 1-like [Curcuma longa]|uniref:cycloartenol-C-24-methyltransferase 1-like n=1 Tax=Curcuma longa TaxID=136217 RepID=UPI003D9DC901